MSTLRFTRHVKAPTSEEAITETKRMAARDGLAVVTVASCRPCVAAGTWLVILVVRPR